MNVLEAERMTELATVLSQRLIQTCMTYIEEVGDGDAELFGFALLMTSFQHAMLSIGQAQGLPPEKILSGFTKGIEEIARTRRVGAS
jgi:hypothetical protein